VSQKRTCREGSIPALARVESVASGRTDSLDLAATRMIAAEYDVEVQDGHKIGRGARSARSAAVRVCPTEIERVGRSFVFDRTYLAAERGRVAAEPGSRRPLCARAEMPAAAAQHELLG